MKFLFAIRYFKSQKSVNAINIIAWISVVAITVVTAALIVVFSVFNGFEDLVKSLYTDFYADIRIAPANGKILTASPLLIKQIKAVANVSQLSFVAEEKAIVMNGENQTIVYVKGVDSNFTNVNSLVQNHHIVRGAYQLGTIQQPQLCMGLSIENALGVDVEKGLYPVTMYLPNRKATNSSTLDALNSFNVMPTGTFTVQQEFDSKYVFTNLPFVKYMLDMDKDAYSAIEVKATDANNVNQTNKALQQLLGSNFKVQTRYQQNQSLFATMQIEKWVIYAITCLILSVAAFNIIGALTMLVLEKQKDIAVLKAMGANDNLIKNIFLSEGLLLATIGTGAGVALATVICFLQIQFHLIKLQGGTFIIDYYPVKLITSDYVITIVTVYIIAITAAYIPAQKAGRQQFSLKS